MAPARYINSLICSPTFPRLFIHFPRNLERERERGTLGFGIGIGMESDGERDEDESAMDVHRDRFRLSTISIALAEAKKNNMEISEPVVACIADLAFKYSENLAKDLELFAQHAGRKSVNMEDVILSAHRNEHLALSLRSFSIDLKAKEPYSEKKRKKKSKKDDVSASGAIHISDL